MMTSQNLDIIRLELAFRLEKNCQCIPARDARPWFELLRLRFSLKAVVATQVTQQGRAVFCSLNLQIFFV